MSLAALTSVTSNYVDFTADGSGSTLNISALTSLTGSQDSLTQSDSGTLEDANVTSLTTGYLSLSSGTVTLSKLTDIDATSVTVSGGASLSLPKVTGYNNTISYYGTHLEATGTGSTLTLAGLTGFIGTTDSTVNVEALAGAQLSLAALTSVTSNYVDFTADGSGSGSTLNISALTSLTGSQDSLTQSDSGTLEDANVTSLTTGYLSLSSGTVTLSKLTDIDATSVTVSGGASLSLPKVTGYNNTISYYGTNLEATGTGSTLTLAGLTGFIGTTDSTVNVEALAGANCRWPR